MLIDGTIGALIPPNNNWFLSPSSNKNKDVLKFDNAFINRMEELYESCGYKSIVDKYLTFHRLAINHRISEINLVAIFSPRLE